MHNYQFSAKSSWLIVNRSTKLPLGATGTQIIYLGVIVHFKLIIAFVTEDKTNKVLDAARQAGATGATVINHARGEGLEPPKTFFGLNLETQRDVLLLLVEEHLSRKILEKIAQVAEFEEHVGAGIAFQIDVEDAIGISHQVRKLTQVVEEEI